MGGVGYACTARGEDGMVTNAAKRMGAVMPKTVVEEKAVEFIFHLCWKRFWGAGGGNDDVFQSG